MQGHLALYEDEQDALRDLVSQLGGFKVVGHILRPDLAPDRAGGWLRDCLNPERAERLQPSQLFHLLRLGREKAIHAPASFILCNIGYELRAIEPEDEKAKLQRQVVEAATVLRQSIDRLERINAMPLASVRAA